MFLRDSDAGAGVPSAACKRNSGKRNGTALKSCTFYTIRRRVLKS